MSFLGVFLEFYEFSRSFFFQIKISLYWSNKINLMKCLEIFTLKV